VQPAGHTIGISGTRLTLDGEPFPLTGLSFFNALFNPAFNRDAGERRRWLEHFLSYGINMLRVWCQWDFSEPRLFADVAPDQSMYTSSGDLQHHVLKRLTSLLLDSDALGMVIELTLFSHEKEPNLPVEVQERGAHLLAGELGAHRNLIIQIWNEKSDNWRRLFDSVKTADPSRLVTSSPGVSNVLGDDEQNRTLDLLTPHTIRRGRDMPFWEAAPRQIEDLIGRFGKPVIDDEPARSGPVQFGGLEGGTRPEWHIEAMARVRAVGGYPVYHHDMVQYGYAAPTTPPNGLPVPEFSPFHRRVFDHLRAVSVP
jgi:hypothetical protein